MIFHPFTYILKKHDTPEVIGLIKQAFDIMKENRNLVLTGSIALILQGMELRRQPDDIDFLYPLYWGWEKPKEWIECDIEGYPSDEGYTPNEYMVNGTKINVMVPCCNTPVHRLKMTVPLELGRVYKMLHLLSIVDFKLSFSFQKDGNPKKHAQDLIYILNKRI